MLAVKPEGKKSFVRPKCRWKDDIEIDHREVELECANWIHLEQDRDRWEALVNEVMNLRVL